MEPSRCTCNSALGHFQREIGHTLYKALMTAEEIEAIVGGYHGDAFRILGPHRVRKRGGQPRWEVRAFSPASRERRSGVGVRRAGLPHGEAARPRVLLRRVERRSIGVPDRARLYDGREVELDDPYRFGPLISDTDLYLHTEGTLHEAYKALGAHPAVAEGAAGVRFAVWRPMPKPWR